MNLKLLIITACLGTMGAFATGCGGDPCKDFEDTVNECCAKAPSGTSCSIKVNDNADSDACQQALDNFKCPY